MHNIIGALVLLFVGFLLLSQCSSGPSEKTKAKRCKDDGLAFVMSQRFVKRELKSPGSARFPAQPSAAYQVDECSITILSYFEAQNSFGARLRGGYKVTMHYNKESDTWSATDLQIDQ